MASRVAITDAEIDVLSLHNWAKDPRAGAVVLFSGITRDSFEGKHVSLLAYDCYRPRAQKTLENTAQEALKRDGILKVALVHRIGEVPLSSESVVIVVASSHRKEGWQIAEWILEEVKRTAEIWKREVYEDQSSQWIKGVERK